MIIELLPLLLRTSGQSPTQQELKPTVVLRRSAPLPRKIYNETADGRAQIAAAVKAAGEDGIRVLINWGSNDDECCTKFSQVQRSPEVSEPRFFADEYKVVAVDVGRLDKNLDLAESYGAKLRAGALPWFVFLDRDAKAVVSSTMSNGKNSGFPAKPDEIAHFKAMLEKTRRILTDEEIAFLVKSLEEANKKTP